MNYPSRFTKFMPFIFKWEGGYDNDPDDPGGETKYGIDKRSHPNEDIKNLTKERATEIYFSDYWRKCGELPPGVGEVVFNIGVNCGNARAGKWLQQAINRQDKVRAIAEDGKIGPMTIAAANLCDGPLLTEMLLDRTEAHYRSIARGRLAKFLRGWLNRNNDLRAYVAKMN
jgi:lysozyme family protein